MKIDEIDRKLLAEIQEDSSLALEALGERVGLSRNACWRRIKSLEAEGIIKRRVALLDPSSLGKSVTVFARLRVGESSENSEAAFGAAIENIDEIQGVFRLSGDFDYLLRLQVADLADYDRIRKEIQSSVTVTKISADFVLESVKDTTSLPL